ncbi:MAG: hypothetical protein P0S93_05790 [Candidatus Neptunochlamydia sp.]|nr:hypothetical protein [Candidatus Neptunochlamydia sp.]
MRSKHLMVTVPAGAIWVVIQTKDWIETLAVGTTLLDLAQAFFLGNPAGGAARQVPNLAGMVFRFTGSFVGAHEMTPVVADQVLRP